MIDKQLIKKYQFQYIWEEDDFEYIECAPGKSKIMHYNMVYNSKTKLKEYFESPDILNCHKWSFIRW